MDCHDQLVHSSIYDLKYECHRISQVFLYLVKLLYDQTQKEKKKIKGFWRYPMKTFHRCVAVYTCLCIDWDCKNNLKNIQMETIMNRRQLLLGMREKSFLVFMYVVCPYVVGCRNWSYLDSVGCWWIWIYQM